ncbi:HTH-type transcriptional regulator Ptr2 [uncultured archaeon]|nr:HTH-type transcriptional regulator Ptr2 [uncultured archaeon]
MTVKLTDNEKKVLEFLLTDGRTSATEIGKHLGITPQAAGKIKDKLEEKGIIKGYTAIVDYSKVGISVFAIGFFKFKSGAWTRLEDEDITNRMSGPHLIRVFRFQEGEFTHMVVYGFRSIMELDHYFHILQTERGHISELKKLYVLSESSILKDSPNELLVKAIQELGKETLARPEQPPSSRYSVKGTTLKDVRGPKLSLR